jgi:teichoic acid transport system permease protein
MLVNMLLTGVVIVIYCFYRHWPSVYYLQLVYYMLCQFLLFTPLTLFNATLSVLSQDYGNFVKSLTTAVFWMSGIMYDASKIHNVWLRRLLKINPVTYICSGYRDCYIYREWFFGPARWKATLAFFAVVILMWCASLNIYRKTRKDLPDVL